MTFLEIKKYYRTLSLLLQIFLDPKLKKIVSWFFMYLFLLYVLTITDLMFSSVSYYMKCKTLLYSVVVRCIQLIKYLNLPCLFLISTEYG